MYTPEEIAMVDIAKLKDNAIEKLETLKAEYDMAYDKAHAQMVIIDRMEENDSLYSDEDFDKAYAEYDTLWKAESDIDNEIYRYENIVEHLKKAYDYYDYNY